MEITLTITAKTIPELKEMLGSAKERLNSIENAAEALSMEPKPNFTITQMQGSATCACEE